MGFSPTFQDGDPSCTKAVTIRLNDTAIKLKQNRQILVNGEDVTSLPTIAGGARIRIASSIFIRVEMPNGLEILWDGVSRVYVNAPADFRGKRLFPPTGQSHFSLRTDRYTYTTTPPPRHTVSFDE
jgi:von Willebrand factor